MPDILNTTLTNPFESTTSLNLGKSSSEATRICANALAGRLPEQNYGDLINTAKPVTIDSKMKDPSYENFDILKDYIWTLSENKNIITQQIPKLIATEYNIETSPIVQNIKAAYAVSKEAFSKNLNIVKGAILTSPEWAKTYNDITTSETATNVTNAFTNARDTVIGKIATATNALPNEQIWHNTKLKELYDHLYTVSRTGNKFIFPYMDDEFLNLTNNFTEGNEYLQFEAGLFTLDTKDAVSKLKKFSSLPALLSPGAYIQSPQFYNFDTTEPSVTISFPLYNIINAYETKKNMNFVKLFGLNNMPYRKNLIAVDPTRIYDILIPGKANFPLCYVSNYSVDHLGTKKLIGDEIYPEAYNVKITFTSLIKYDVNMFLETMNMASKYMPPPGREPIRINTPTQQSVPNTTKEETITKITDENNSVNYGNAAFMGLGGAPHAFTPGAPVEINTPARAAAWWGSGSR
jgi:hypothetical protein